MNEPFPRAQTKIAVIGGGTGSFVLLGALKEHTSAIAALVNMVDDGGSTGVLRDELGTLPPGDVRQCLVALSDSPKLRDLFNYRFEEGTFGGHAFGNILLSALEKMTGSFSEAVETASEILRINGTVIPATLDDTRLRMEWPDAHVLLEGEGVIDAETFSHDPRHATLTLMPRAKANPAMLAAIEQADLVVIAPGDLYTSLGPLLIIDGVGKALAATKATTLYVTNLVTKKDQTDDFTVADHANEIERLAGTAFLDYVFYNEQQPGEALTQRYREEGAYLVQPDHQAFKSARYTAIAGNFLGPMAVAEKNDTLPVTRSYIRHNPQAVAAAIMELYESTDT